MFPFTDEDLQEPVNNIIEKKISPMLARDGGAIELLDIKNAKVYIQLKGACVGCSASGGGGKCGCMGCEIFGILCTGRLHQQWRGCIV